MPLSRATLTASACSRPISSGRAAASGSVATCSLGTTSTCTGAPGLMSGKARPNSSSARRGTWISPRTILQKRQSIGIESTSHGRSAHLPREPARSSEELPGIEQQGHGPLIDDADCHGSAKDALFDAQAPFTAEGAEARVERLGRFRPGGGGERRSATLAGVAQQGELGDREQAAAGVEQRAVHL